MTLRIAKYRWINFSRDVDYLKLFDEVAGERIWRLNAELARANRRG